MTVETIEWRAPAPLWPLAVADAAGSERFREPALLRFADDDFMQRLQATLRDRPDAVADHVLRYENWEDERSGWLEQAALAQEARTPRLYHPAHGRFYVVAASLVCFRFGLPDRKVDRRLDESASFVVRRLLPKTPGAGTGYDEQAWAEVDGSGQWVAAPDPTALVAGEQRQPMFPLRFRQDQRPRTLWTGFVPVVSNDATPRPAPQPADPALATDPRVVELGRLRSQVLDEFDHRLALFAIPGGGDDPERERRQDASSVFLIELAEFLRANFPLVWDALGTGGSPSLSARQADLLAALRAGVPIGEADLTWGFALRDAFDRRRAFFGLEAGTPPLYDLGGVENDQDLRALFGALGAAVDELKGKGEPPVPSTLPVERQPKLADGVLYRIFCVYERPRCGGLEPPVLSTPSRPFTLAPFYDPEAPVRPVTIQMPDIGPKALSRYRKGVSIALNKELHSLVERFKKYKLDDPDQLPSEPTFDLGMICSLSIPIITICALILLIIIVYVLNFVFWWVPYLMVCFPKPRS